MADGSLEPAQPVVGVAASRLRPDGVWTFVHVPTSVFLGFPLPLSSFQGASSASAARRFGQRGVGDLFPLVRPVKYFLTGFFQARRGGRTTRVCGPTASLWRRLRRFRSFVRAFRGAAPGCWIRWKVPAAGGLEGRRGLTRTLFPVKRFRGFCFPLRMPEGRSPQAAAAEGQA